MMLTTLMLLLLSADSHASVAVVSTSAPGLEKAAGEAGRTLGTRLEALYVDLGSHLKSHGPECQRDVRCLTAAPGLTGASRLLHLHLRSLPGGQLSVDLRLMDMRARTLLGRSASAVAPGELAAWVERTAARLLAQADPYARVPLPSPFAAQPASSAPTQSKPAATGPDAG